MGNGGLSRGPGIGIGYDTFPPPVPVNMTGRMDAGRKMGFTRRGMLALGGVGAAGAWLNGYRPDPRGPAVPAGRAAEATALGIPDERYMLSAPGGTDALVRGLASATHRRQVAMGLPVSAEPLLDKRVLALSGGGENGAFGAGVLSGWSAHGSRPTFHLVTGVSVGALIAPFAFIGSSRDAELRDLFSNLTADKVMQPRGLVGGAVGESLADNAPLLATISEHLDARMMAEIARGHAEGRLLLVGTVNLDAQAAVWWNLGAIAASGHRGALNLMRQVLLASAAIPGLFPPSMIDVTLDGRRFEEMHVDGGALAQTFVYPAELGAQRRERIRQGLPVPSTEAYIICNTRLHGAPMPVGLWSISIAERAIAALIRANGLGDVWRIHDNTERDGIGFNLAVIGDDFTPMPVARFDPGYMRALFHYAEDKARNGYDWLKAPPV